MGGYVRSTVIASLLVGVLSVVGFSPGHTPCSWAQPWHPAYRSSARGSRWRSRCSRSSAGHRGHLHIVISLVVVNVVDNMISPLIMQSAVNVHQCSRSCHHMGSALGGIVGMIIGHPLSAAMKGGFVYFFETRTGRQLVSDGAFFRSTRSTTQTATSCPPTTPSTTTSSSRTPPRGHRGTGGQADSAAPSCPRPCRVLHRRFEQIARRRASTSRAWRHHGSQRTSDGRTAAVGTGRWRVRGDEPAAPQDESQAVITTPQNDPQDEMGEGKDS